MTGLDGDGVRVVLIGTGTHTAGSRLPDVPAVSTTVRAVRDCLIEVCGVREPYLVTLEDPDGPEPVLDAVLAAAEDASDALLVYYVGHGVLDAGARLHLATRATVDLRTKAGFQALDYNEILNAVAAKCRARTVAVVLDCCYSGRADVPARNGAVLVSADRDEQALAPAGEPHTAFSGELVAALREGIGTAPARITLRHLNEHLSRVMRALGRPEPRLRTGNAAGELVLAANRADRSVGIVEAPATPWEGSCPYRGLEPFTAADEQLFHGRRDLVEDVLGRLLERAHVGGVTVVSGPSGSGKTSLLRAGVLPAVAHGDLGVPGSASWPQIVVTPGEDPIGALAAQLAEWGADTGRASDAATLAVRLAEGPERARAAVRDAAGDRWVVVVDQFEEIFGAGVPETTRVAFVSVLDAISTATGDEDPPALVILGLRSDFGGHCTRFPELLAAMRDRQIPVGPMTTTSLRSVIVEPARQAGLALEAGLVELLLRDTGADPDREGASGYDPGSLPLLSHALLATWQRRRGNLLTVAGYRDIGGVAGAVSTTAEQTFTELRAAEQDGVRWLLLRMVMVGDDTPDTRRRVNPAVLLEDHPDQVATMAALDAFATARLIIVDRDCAEISHEALIWSWPRLRGWMDVDREGRIVAQEIETDAAAWRAGARDSARLYRGDRLARAVGATNGGVRDDLSPAAREFLRDSARQARRNTRRLRGLVAVLTVLLLVAVSTTVLALHSGSVAAAQRDDAVFHQVITQATQLETTNPSLAAQLDVLAYRMNPTPEQRVRVLNAGGSPLATTLAAHSREVTSAAFNRDGDLLATGSFDHTVRVWDTTDPRHPVPLGEPLTGPDSVDSVALSPDGRTLAAGDEKGQVWLWRIADNDRSHPVPLGRPLTGPADTVSALAFDPGSATLAAGSHDHKVWRWTVTDPSRPLPLGPPLIGPADAVYTVALSPDGRTLAAGGHDKTVWLWNVADPVRPIPLGPPLAGPTDSVFSVAFRPDGGALAVGSADGSFRLWDMTNPAQPIPVGKPVSAHPSALTTVAFSPDGRTLATGSQDATERLWNVTVPVEPSSEGPPLPNDGAAVYTTSFGRDGRTLVGGAGDGTVRLWDLPSDRVTGPTDIVTSARFSPDGRVLAAVANNGSGQLWNTLDPVHPVPVGPPLDGHVYAVAFSPVGHVLAVATRDPGPNHHEGSVQLWDTTEPARLVPLGRPLAGFNTTGGPHSIVFGPTGRTLSVGTGSGPVKLWDTSDPVQAAGRSATLATSRAAVRAVAFSLDGRRLAATGEDHRVWLWDTTDPGRPVPIGAPLSGNVDAVNTVAFGADASVLVTGSDDNSIRIWNIADPARVAPPGLALPGQSGAVESVTFSPDRQTMATASADATVRLWDTSDAAHPLSRGQLTDQETFVITAEFSPDGRTLVTGGGDQVLQFWSLDANAAVDRICDAVGNTLTPAQWQTYVPGATPGPLC